MEHPWNSVRNRRTSRGLRPLTTALARGASLEFCSQLTTLSWFAASDGAGAWSVFGIPCEGDHLLVVCGVWRRSPPRGLRRLQALVCGASSEFCSRSPLARGAFLEFRAKVIILSWFAASDGAGAWSVLRISARRREVRQIAGQVHRQTQREMHQLREEDLAILLREQQAEISDMKNQLLEMRGCWREMAAKQETCRLPQSFCC